jgi:hypothetical protein
MLAALVSSCAAAEGPTPLAAGVPPAEPPARDAPAARSVAAQPSRLELIDDFNPPKPAPAETIDAPGARWDAALGGLSGLSYDRASTTLYAISDSSHRFQPRLYAFDVELTQSSLRVTPKAVHFLREGAPTGLLEDLDAESITGDGHGGFYVGTENGFDRPHQPVPRILRLQGDGLVTGTLTLPEAYLPGAEPAARGTRSNLAFEGIALSPGGRWLTAIVESTLQQDGDEPSFEHGAPVRLLRWDLTAHDPPVEYFYPVEPIPRPPRGTPTGGGNGVSELVSLDDQRLLVLERAYVPLAESQGPNTIRIFETTLSSEPARPGAPPRLLSKRLVLDLDAIVPKLEPGKQSLDNLEGMTLGPELPSGEKSLLLVSDDNFGANQRTVFLAFRVLGLQGD